MRLGRAWGGLGLSLSGLGWGGLGRSWSHLGAMLRHLGQAWGHLGAILGWLGEPKTLIFLTFFNDFCNIDVSNKNSHLGRS